MNKQWIFGLGTGRCGSMSLANLLSFQKDCLISHELGGRPMLSWDGNGDLSKFLKTINSRRDRVIGDVSFYLLPYANKLLGNLTDVKFIILKRDKKATIDSYLKKSEGRNHWIDHNNTKWRSKVWDRC